MKPITFEEKPILASLTRRNTVGTKFRFCSHGGVRAIECQNVFVNLFTSTEMEASLANIYLRAYDDAGQIADVAPLLGPQSHSLLEVTDDERLLIKGAHVGVQYVIELVLAHAEHSWFWHIDLLNTETEARQFDLVCMQDVGLNLIGNSRLSEAYVSQYVDFTPLQHPDCGQWLAVRQNALVQKQNPWLAMGSLSKGVGFATDAIQIYGLSQRVGRDIPLLHQVQFNQRVQHEHGLAVIVDEAFTLGAGAQVRKGFFGHYVAHHAQPSSEQDGLVITHVLANAEARWNEPTHVPTTPIARAKNLFAQAQLLRAEPLSAEQLRHLYPDPWLHTEHHEGQLASFFTDTHGRRHVVTQAKELSVLRPHGHMLRTGTHWTTDESALTTTVWMAGVFNSLLTQGHVSANRLLSTQRGYLSLFRSQGQRVFANFGDGYRLLDTPSCFDMSENECTWYYKHSQGLIRVVTRAHLRSPEVSLSLDVLEGKPVKFIVSHHLAINDGDGFDAKPIAWERIGSTITLMPNHDSMMAQRFPEGYWKLKSNDATMVEHVSTDGLLFYDFHSHTQPYLCIETLPTVHYQLTLSGHLVDEADGVIKDNNEYFNANAYARLRIEHMPEGESAQALSRLTELMPWLGHNALVHYLAPRGLEQFSGGGWGVRDVSQGPTELLLAVGQFDALRQLLLQLFSAQESNGDWPQWFMFFKRDAHIRAPDFHGDVIFWPVVALAQYLSATGDASILQEDVPFYPTRGEEMSSAPLSEHVNLVIKLTQERVIDGTHLAAYGHGDWNDALQPADPDLREHMSSAWTVTLHYRMLSLLAQAYHDLNMDVQAEELEQQAAIILADFHKHLVVDDVVTGYALFGHSGADIRYLLHPADKTTGLQYSVLPMIHAIIDNLFTPEQAQAHLDIIEQHLLAPDGVRLFDKPLPYHGGTMKIFQRGESASFFGREVGLMYTHAHLRYAEALAHVGRADAFFDALNRINPIGLRALIPNSTPRQVNCYSSSSDALFADRYAAYTDYDKIRKGEIALESGWRVYSSGAGIELKLIIQSLFGLQQTRKTLIFDPVLPTALNGTRIQVHLFGRAFAVTYQVAEKGCGVRQVSLNGQKLTGTYLPNPYRTGAFRVNAEQLPALLQGENQLVIELE